MTLLRASVAEPFATYADRLKRRRLATLLLQIHMAAEAGCSVCRYSRIGMLHGWTTEPIPHVCGEWQRRC